MRALIAVLAFASTAFAAESYEVNDSHFHLTNYIQEGADIRDFVKIMGNRVGRVALFGIPLQQQWAYKVDGMRAPTYYLESDAPLYYYSFTDAVIATAYLSLPREDRARFDPMITGFNPSDMYAADHVRRVLKTFPGVFSGIGEFSVHKEFVSAKIPGETASLTDPALDRLLDFAGEAGLAVILHSDVDTPFPKGQSDVAEPDQPLRRPAYLDQMETLFKRHPGMTIIWAHLGLGRIVRPVEEYGKLMEEILGDPVYKNVLFDISWTELAKYLSATPETIGNVARIMNEYPDRFLFGTDEVAPKNQETYLKILKMYEPLLARLEPKTREKVLKRNYQRVFDEARRRVRAWEKANLTSEALAQQR